jgi:indolepyruvate ferredoxin oxidoreductase
MAPPLLAKPKNGQPPKKIVMGPWLLTAMRWLAKAKALRGGSLDLFGRTAERRMERALICEFEARLDALLQDLSAERQSLAAEIAKVPLSMRGFGHVKLANIALARAREAELLHRYNPQRYARPAQAAQAGQIRGIAVVGA